MHRFAHTAVLRTGLIFWVRARPSTFFLDFVRPGTFWIFFVRPGAARYIFIFFWNFFNTKVIKIIYASEKILMFVLIFNKKTKYMTSKIDKKRIKQWYYYLIPTLEPVSILKPENFQKLKPGPARPVEARPDAQPWHTQTNFYGWTLALRDGETSFFWDNDPGIRVT